MNGNRSKIARRLGLVAWTLLASATLSIACGNNGGIGDGVLDDPNAMPPQAGATATGGSSAGGGRSGSSSGGTRATAGNSTGGGAAGAGGSGGLSGAGGNAGGTSGSSGAAGTSGGAGAPAGGNAGSGGTASAGGAGAGGSSGNAAAGGGAGGLSGSGGGSGGSVSTTCGNGTVESGETCDLLSTDPDYGRTCSNTCFKVGSPDCLACELGGDCFESVDNCLGPNGGFTEEQRTLCYAVVHCIQSTNCFDGAGTLGKCYCGSLNTAECGAAPYTGAGSPDGVCKAAIQTGMPGVSSNATVLAGLAGKTRPAGAAGQRLTCQKTASSAECSDVCGFKSGGPAFP